MILLDIFRWFSGYVDFTASKGFPERFINLCAVNSIDLRNTKVNGENINAEVKAKDYRKLRQIAKKSGMKITVISKHGLYFELHKNKKRVGLLIGAAFFALFMYVTSLFIWNVDVIGCENVSKEYIAQTLAELGVHEGSFKRGIDTEELTNLAMIKLSEKVSWLAINIKGTKATVEVRDFVPKREDVTYKEPCNIVADFDGLILTLEVYNGHKANFEGNGVNKGDLLISGIFENRNTSSQFMEARGKITALHNVSSETATPKKLKCKKITGTEQRTELSIFSIKIPLGFFEKRKEKYVDFSSVKQMEYSGTKLPFAIIKDTRVYYKQGVLNDDNVTLRALDDYMFMSYSKFKNTNIVSSEMNLSIEDESVLVSSNNKCIDYMGVKEKIFVN